MFFCLKELNTESHAGLCSLWTMIEAVDENDDRSVGFLFVVRSLCNINKQIDEILEGMKNDTD